jgi:hypothetical protein
VFVSAETLRVIQLLGGRAYLVGAKYFRCAAKPSDPTFPLPSMSVVWRNEQDVLVASGGRRVRF